MTVIFVAEERPEGRRGVETGKAQPVNTAIRADERPGMAVADEGVVLDREGHGLLPCRQ